jgi:hypothetical protein
MSFVLAQQQGWDPSSLSFNVVGDVYGGLWALSNDEAQGFLWEKYTTQPFVDQGKCKRIGEVLTPWPCFVIAVRNEVLNQEAELLNAILAIIQTRAQDLKNSSDAAEVIAWRYALKQNEVQQWLNKTEWSYCSDVATADFEKVISTLGELDLISADEMQNWQQKLFS